MRTFCGNPGPARILLVARGRELERVRRVLGAEGHLVEVVDDASAVVERLRRPPRIDVLAVDALDDRGRACALGAAREQRVWCVYLESRGEAMRLPSEERAVFVTAVAADADEAQIARTLRAVIAAQRSGP